MWFDKSYRRHLCDMPFWPYECHCEHCKKRFADEVGGLEEELLCDGKNHTVTVVFDAGVCEGRCQGMQGKRIPRQDRERQICRSVGQT